MTSDKKRIRPVIEEVVNDTPHVTSEEHVEQNPIGHPHAEEATPVVHHHSPEEKAKNLLAEIGHPKASSHEVHGRTSFKLILFITILTALIVGFVSGGVYVYMTGISTLDSSVPLATTTPAPTPVSTPTPLPSATPQAKVDVSTYKLSILNGNGKAGEAGRVKTLVEKAGFKVTNTGNAVNSKFTNTVIEYKKDVPQVVLEQLEESLSGTYTVKMGEELKSTSQFDIVVTVGSLPAQ